MVSNNINSDKWRSDQIKFFKEYLNTFKENSMEYKLIKKGIDDLENL